MSQLYYANLAPLIRTASIPVTEHLVSAVAHGDLDLLKLQRDLEAESVEWSNKKINKVTQAIRELW